jgi:uncharacterized protein
MVINRLINKILLHYYQFYHKEPMQIILHFLFENVLVALSLGYCILFFFPKYSKSPFQDIPILILIINAIIVAPFIETLVFQVIPVSITIKNKKSVVIQLLSSMCPFSIVHLVQYGLIGLVSGVIGGYYLSLSYIIWRKRNNKYAFLLTTLTHSLYNLIILIIYLIVIN